MEPEVMFPITDWQYEVANGDTKLGYAEWLEHQIESNTVHAILDRMRSE